MEVIAKRYGSNGWMPVLCPEYRDGSVSCVSRSGDSLCGLCFGVLKELPAGHAIINCHFDAPDLKVFPDPDFPPESVEDGE